MIDRFAVAVLLLLSCTSTVKLDNPVVVGVPEITPVLGAMLSPAGNDPLDMLHVYGGTPPVAVTVCEYAVPTTPSGKLVVVIVNGVPETIVSVSGCDAVLSSLSVTSIVNDVAPAVVGVPDITPVLPASDNPPGNAFPILLHVYGGVPPDAASVVEYAVPTVPFGRLVVVIVKVDDESTVMLKLAVPILLSLSVAVTVNDAVPTVVAVPLITPVLESMVSPVGSAPAEIVHV